ncbi:MAG: hypothetical protein ACI9TV_000122 [Sulfurimonas sp.]|jgi:hypothetical protein|uniref:DUF4139 domain-containing protein n=1 Tax=Sulfurimonas sp. TaxID=2022749 RepID=UPI0039E29CFC
MKNLSLALLSSVLLSSSLFAVTLNSNTQDNSLIIYNSNVGLVHESRDLQLNKDETSIIYEDVASSINTDSVNVSLPSGVSLYAQQYRFDKLTQNKLLNAYIGKKVSVKILKDTKSFKTISATLLSNDGASCIVKFRSQIIIVESKNIIFDSIPDELITKPSLVWNINTNKKINAKMSIDYLINQITWKSNYILNLDGDSADLSGWITINNRSGKAFENTSLRVLAGEINRARQPRQNYSRMKNVAMMADATPEVAHQAHEGYHFYSIPLKVNLANNEKTQIKFISQDNIDIQRKYKAQMNNPNYFGGEVKHDVTQLITIKGFEFPTPKGIVRTYSNLGSTNILLGESNIGHTPKNTPISLTLGKNFDIKVKETLVERDRTTWYHDNSVQYSIKNSSNENKTVEILVPFSNNPSDEVKSKEKYTFTKGNLLAFEIQVKANTTKKFNVYYRTKIQK